MKRKNCLEVERSRAFMSGTFVFSVLLTVGVLAGNVPWENLLMPSVIYVVWNIAWGSYVQLIFICGVIPYGTSYLADVKYHYMRYQVFRSDLRSYLWIKVAVTAWSGFWTVFLGKLVFAVIVRIFCPVMQDIDFERMEQIGSRILIWKNPWLFLLADAVLYALAAAAFAVLALLVSAITRNWFVTVMSPLVLFFAVTSIQRWIQVPQWLEFNGLLMGYIERYENHAVLTVVHILTVWIISIALLGMIFVRYGERRFQHE